MSRFATLRDERLERESAADTWLSIVRSPMPDISEAHARRILDRPAPSQIRIDETEPAVF